MAAKGRHPLSRSKKPSPSSPVNSGRSKRTGHLSKKAKRTQCPRVLRTGSKGAGLGERLAEAEKMSYGKKKTERTAAYRTDGFKTGLGTIGRCAEDVRGKKASHDAMVQTNNQFELLSRSGFGISSPGAHQAIKGSIGMGKLKGGLAHLKPLDLIGATILSWSLSG